MAYIHCENTKCKFYFEDSCDLNINGKMVCLDREGCCEDFEPGVNECYAHIVDAKGEGSGE